VIVLKGCQREQKVDADSTASIKLNAGTTACLNQSRPTVHVDVGGSMNLSDE